MPSWSIAAQMSACNSLPLPSHINIFDFLIVWINDYKVSAPERYVKVSFIVKNVIK